MLFAPRVIPMLSLVVTLFGGSTTPTDGFFESGGARLSYTIDHPAGSGAHPAIVLVHEGGQVTKDQQRAMADALVARGFVVLRFDKRGTGKSGGRFEEVSPENSVRQIALLASDVVAAVNTLKADAAVNASRIGLVGISQAGWVMPLAASQSADVKFMAAVVGPTVPVGPLYDYAGRASDASKSNAELSAEFAAFKGTTGFDPLPSLRRLSIPMLYQMAANDRVVPHTESLAVLNALAKNGKAITIKTYPGGHEMRQSTVYLNDLLTWLDARR